MLSSLAGGALLGRRYGAGAPDVVAFHGWRRTHADFDAVLEGLDAVAPDLPGFGATAPPPASWGSAEYAAAVAPLLDDAPASGTVVVGHSFGGRVAVQLCALRPGRVRGLVLTGVPLCPPPGSRPAKAAVTFRLARALNRIGVVSDAPLEARRRRSGSEDYRLATGVMRDVLVRVIGETNAGLYLDVLSSITQPVEFVWGELDTAAPIGVVERAAGACGGPVSVRRLAGVGHLTPTSAPDELRAAIERLR